MKMTYSMRQQHALIKMNAIFKFACHKDVAQLTDFLIDGRRSLIWELRLGD